MAFQVKNVRQALDALAFYSAKVAVYQLQRELGRMPSYDTALDRAYAVVYDQLKSSDIFNQSLQRHLPKFCKAR